jgi:hypothetical protein
MLSSFSLKAKIYIILVYLTSIFLVIYTFKEHHLYANIGIVGIIFFSILAIIAESLCVLLNDISISTGFTVTLASILSFNPAAAIIIVSLGTAFRVQKRDDKIVHIFNTAIHKTLFNVSNLIISIVISTRVFEFAGGKYNDVLNINKYVIPSILRYINIYSTERIDNGRHVFTSFAIII